MVNYTKLVESKNLFARTTCLLDERNVVALEHNSSQCLALVRGLDVVFFRVVEDEIHVLVKAQNSSLNAVVDVFKDPDADSRAILEISED